MAGRKEQILLLPSSPWREFNHMASPYRKGCWETYLAVSP